MKTLLSSDLKSLIDQPAGTCVSIYVPMHLSGGDVQQDPIRVKNQLHEAEKSLLGAGFKNGDAKKFLAPAYELTGNDLFWRQHSNGLAMFIAPGMFKSYRLPAPVDALTLVSDRFHLKPLLRLLTDDGKFFVLAISLNKIRLLDATRYTVREVPLANMPDGMSDSFRASVHERQLQFHSEGVSSPGRPGSVSFGTGPGSDDSRDNIIRYFRMVDKELHATLNGNRTPLVLAGVDYLLPMYREVNTYGHLAEQSVTGSPDLLSDELLRDRAWSAAEPVLQKGRDTAKNTFKELGITRTTNDVVNAVTAAMQGKIESLFVPSDLQCWGRVDPANATVEMHESRMPQDHDLLDFATIQTITKNGAVYIVEPGQVPGGGHVAAVFRY